MILKNLEPMIVEKGNWRCDRCGDITWSIFRDMNLIDKNYQECEKCYFRDKEKDEKV